MWDISPRLCVKGLTACAGPAQLHLESKLVSLGPVFYWVESRSMARHVPFGHGTHLDKVTTGL